MTTVKPERRRSMSRPPARCLLALFCVSSFFALAACGGDSSAPPAVVQTIEVSPGQPTLTSLGTTQQFSAVAKDPSGAVISGQVFGWASSNGSVAGIDVAGRATSTGNG